MPRYRVTYDVDRSFTEVYIVEADDIEDAKLIVIEDAQSDGEFVSESDHGIERADVESVEEVD